MKQILNENACKRRASVFSTFLVSWKSCLKWQEIEPNCCVCMVLALITQQGFSIAFIMLMKTEILKQHNTWIFLKHCMWSSEPELPASPVVNQDSKFWKFLTCVSQGVRGGVLQEFCYCQCCRITCSNLKKIYPPLCERLSSFITLTVCITCSPVHALTGSHLETLSSEHPSLADRLTA